MPQTRMEMIRETEAWLTWALAHGDDLPRIPTRRVDRGGFSELVRRPMGRVLAAHWWSEATRGLGLGQSRGRRGR